METNSLNRKMGRPLNTKHTFLEVSRIGVKGRVLPLISGLSFVLAAAGSAAQQPLSWDQVKARFEANNPALKADADNVDEMTA